MQKTTFSDSPECIWVQSDAREAFAKLVGIQGSNSLADLSNLWIFSIRSEDSHEYLFLNGLRCRTFLYLTFLRL